MQVVSVFILGLALGQHCRKGVEIWETDTGLSVLGNFNQWLTGCKATITSSFKVL